MFLERENLQLRKCLYEENSNGNKVTNVGNNNNINHHHYNLHSNMVTGTTSAGRYQGIK